MKTNYAFALIFLIAFGACGKDKFTTEPKVNVRDITPDPVLFGNLIEVTSDFTDDEGDLDSVIIVYKWYNGPIASMVDTFRYSINNLNIPPKTRKGDVIIQFAYGKRIQDYVILGAVAKDTTASFGLVLVDKDKHRSNYDESDKVRLKKQ